MDRNGLSRLQRLGGYAEQCRVVYATLQVIDELLLKNSEGEGRAICYKSPVRDKEGKLIKCEAYIDKSIL